MQKLKSEIVYAASSKFKETKLIDNWVLWLDQRPSELGRTTLLIRRWGHPESSSFEPSQP